MYTKLPNIHIFDSLNSTPIMLIMPINLLIMYLLLPMQPMQAKLLSCKWSMH